MTRRVRVQWLSPEGVWANIVQAKSDHECRSCGAPIPKGDLYYAVNALNVVKLCDACGDQRRLDGPTAGEVPTTILTIRWGEAMTGSEIRDLSRALAAKISERTDAFDVRVRTFGTAA